MILSVIIERFYKKELTKFTSKCSQKYVKVFVIKDFKMSSQKAKKRNEETENFIQKRSPRVVL